MMFTLLLLVILLVICFIALIPAIIIGYISEDVNKNSFMNKLLKHLGIRD